jgi:hypothetical protein
MPRIPDAVCTCDMHTHMLNMHDMHSELDTTVASIRYTPHNIIPSRYDLGTTALMY